MSNPIVFITGGAGFIGRETARLLLERGWSVRALDCLDPQIHGTTRPVLPDGMDLIEDDVRDGRLLAGLLRDADAVLHLAAKTGVGQSMYAVSDYVDTNVGGTAVLLETLARGGHKVKRLVVASSRAIYGEGAYRCGRSGPVHPAVRTREQMEAGRWECACPQCGAAVEPIPTPEGKPLAPGSVYAISKRDQEEMCLCLGAAYGIETVALRYFNVYGPGQPLNNPYTGVIPAMAARVLSGQAAEVYEDGAPLRDFVHVQDVARANVLALESDVAVGMAVNIGASEPVSIGQAAGIITRILDGSRPPRVSGKFRVGDVRHCYADLTRARQVLGYEPSVSFEQGICGMADWLRAAYEGDFSAQAAEELRARGLLGTGRAE